MNSKDHFSLHQFFIEHYEVIFQVLGIILLVMILSYILSVVYKRFHPKFVKSQRFWDDALMASSYKPLQIAIWLSGLAFVILVASNYADAFAWVTPFRKVSLVLLLYSHHRYKLPKQNSALCSPYADTKKICLTFSKRTSTACYCKWQASIIILYFCI